MVLALLLAAGCSPSEPSPAGPRPGRDRRVEDTAFNPDTSTRSRRDERQPPSRSGVAPRKRRRDELLGVRPPGIVVTPVAPSRAALTDAPRAPEDTAPSQINASVRMRLVDLAGLIEARTTEPLEERAVRMLDSDLRAVVRREGAIRVVGVGPRLEVFVPIVATLGGTLEQCSKILGQRRCANHAADLTHRAELRVVVHPVVAEDWALRVDIEESSLSSKAPTKLRVGPVSVALPSDFDAAVRAAGDHVAKQVVATAVQELRLREALETYWAAAQQPRALGRAGLQAVLVPEQLSASELWSDEALVGVDVALTATLQIGRGLVPAPRPLAPPMAPPPIAQKTASPATKDGRVQAHIPVCLPLAEATAQIRERLQAPISAGGQRFTVDSAELYGADGGLVLATSFTLGDANAPIAAGKMFFRGTPEVVDGLVRVPDLAVDVATGDFLVDAGLEWLVQAKVEEQLAKLLVLQIAALTTLEDELNGLMGELAAPPLAVQARVERLAPHAVTVDASTLCVVMRAEGALELALLCEVAAKPAQPRGGD